MRNERRVIEKILLINPMLYVLQEKIEQEQNELISDIESPAEKVVKRLIELDNKRIDLCNLKVLYGFIERGLGDKFELLRACALSGSNCGLYKLAVKQIELAGYTVERVDSEFDYLFKLLKRRRRVKAVVTAATNDLASSCC